MKYFIDPISGVISKYYLFKQKDKELYELNFEGANK